MLAADALVEGADLAGHLVVVEACVAGCAAGVGEVLSQLKGSGELDDPRGE